MKDVSRSRVIAIMQARTGSNRFPGKMLAELAGEPLIYHVICRAQRLQSVHEIVLATTTQTRDEPLVRLAQSMGVRVIRGPEENVLHRFIMAINATQADVIIRICGDAPLFDPQFIDQSVSLLKEYDGDLVVLRNNVPTAYQGASVISARALRWIWEVARNDPLASEHVTAYASVHSDQLRTVTIDPDPELLGEYHLSIDTMADLESIREIYRQLYVPGEIVALRDVVRLLKAVNA